jgi:hypothetical protein
LCKMLKKVKYVLEQCSERTRKRSSEQWPRLRVKTVEKFPIDRVSFPKNMRNSEMKMVGTGNSMEIRKSW